MIFNSLFPRGRVLPRLVIVSALISFSGMAQSAGLFEDTEARKAIIDLRQKVQKLEQAGVRTDESLSQVPTTQALLELSRQNNELQDQISRLLGRNEELTRDISIMNDRLKALDALASIEARLAKLEPIKVTVDGEIIEVSENEKVVYDQAMNALRAGEFAQAEVYLRRVASEFPRSGYRPSVLFWLGNAEYATNNYAGALTTFSTMLQDFPEHSRISEAMLATANCQFELQQKDVAIATLNALVARFPGSQAAEAATQRLTALESSTSSGNGNQ